MILLALSLKSNLLKTILPSLLKIGLGGDVDDGPLLVGFAVPVAAADFFSVFRRFFSLSLLSLRLRRCSSVLSADPTLQR